MPRSAMEAGTSLGESMHNQSRNQMLEINRVQKEYYESRFRAQENKEWREEAANTATNVWTYLRRKMLRLGDQVGIDEYIDNLHKIWLDDLSEAVVLDLGCFSGNTLSLWIARKSKEYIGIDLSIQAIECLNNKLRTEGIDNARGVCSDILSNEFPDNYFDVIYARGVLHHFEDLDVLLEELARILKPDGVIVALDPLETAPENRLFRMLFRPFQSDRAWEWPFNMQTFKTFRRHFLIEELQGYYGLVKIGFPLMMIPGLERLGLMVSRWGGRFDIRHAREFGPCFSLCWRVAIKLRWRPAS